MRAGKPTVPSSAETADAARDSREPVALSCRDARGILAIACTVFLVVPGAAAQNVIFVHESLASGANDGSSWGDAFRGPLALQSALAAASAGDELWVTGGTYLPVSPGGSRDVSFEIPSGIRIFGGFAGGEATRDERDPAANETVLSGDFNGNDDGGIDFDNTRHVVHGVSLSSETLFDGLIIRGGYADSGILPIETAGGNMLLVGGAPRVVNCRIERGLANVGGGICLVESSAEIRDCLFTENKNYFLGGGLAHVEGGQARIIRCQFVRNNGESGVGLYNGALDPFHAERLGGAPEIIDCDFIENEKTVGGGSGIGLFDAAGTPRIERCRFISNKTGAGGGGVYLVASGAFVNACDFVDNVGQSDGGGAIYTDDEFFLPVPPVDQTPLMVNCRFVGNNGVANAQFGGRIIFVNCTMAHNSIGSDFQTWPTFLTGPEARVELYNCVVWGNRPRFDDGFAGVFVGDGDYVIERSCVEFWDNQLPGSGNIAAGPRFVFPAGPDGIRGTEDDDVRMRATTPCADAGDNTLVPPGLLLDLTGMPRYCDWPAAPDVGVPGGDGGQLIVDMGAYEVCGSIRAPRVAAPAGRVSPRSP